MSPHAHKLNHEVDKKKKKLIIGSSFRTKNAVFGSLATRARVV